LFRLVALIALLAAAFTATGLLATITLTARSLLTALASALLTATAAFAATSLLTTITLTARRLLSALLTALIFSLFVSHNFLLF
jgi:hypothetical protein